MPKSSRMNFTPSPATLAKGSAHAGGVLEQDRLGDLEAQTRRARRSARAAARGPPSPEGRPGVSWRTERFTQTSSGRSSRAASACQLRSVHAGALKHPAADLLDHAGLLRDVDEVRGGDEPALGVLPAQRAPRPLRSRRRAARRSAGRATVSSLALQRPSQVVLDRQALDRARTHRPVEDLKAPAALAPWPGRGRRRRRGTASRGCSRHLWRGRCRGSPSRNARRRSAGTAP